MEDSTAEATCLSVEEKVDRFVEGDLEHAGEILSALWEIASAGGGAQPPEGTSSTGIPSLLSFWFTSPVHWSAVRAALIKSIRNGVFFDRKYWARHSKAGDVKPIYFSSTIMADKSQQLKKRGSKLCYGFVEVLNVHSGELFQESEHSGERPRGGLEH